jgi:tetratricopeptide (TPR) repeat protein
VGNYWKTLGIARYRAGDWEAAVAALDKSREFRRGGDAFDWLFLAMAHRKLGYPDEARRAYEQAVQWLEKNQDVLEKNKGQADELRRFRAEAEEVLERKTK